MKIDDKLVPFLDLKIENFDEKQSILKIIETVFSHGRFLLGPELVLFEEKFSAYCRKRYAVGVGSGTDALFLLLKALNIGPGDEVITTAMSWIATANAIRLTGATPVFADIQNDLNIDPYSVENLVTSKTRVIMPVHYCGRICDMTPIIEISKKYNLIVVEDASQAVGSTFDNHPPGFFTDYACFSLNPMKVLGACGEAGIVACNSESVAKKLEALRYNGMVDKEICIEPSLNGRMDTLQAAILLERFKYVDTIVKKRREIAKFYTENLLAEIVKPSENMYEYNNYYTYTIQIGRRDDLMQYLSEQGIETKIHHRYLMSEQEPYKSFSYKRPENAERLVKNILSLPCHEKLSIEEADYVIKKINHFFAS